MGVAKTKRTVSSVGSHLEEREGVVAAQRQGEVIAVAEVRVPQERVSAAQARTAAPHLWLQNELEIC